MATVHEVKPAGARKATLKPSNGKAKVPKGATGKALDKADREIVARTVEMILDPDRPPRTYYLIPERLMQQVRLTVAADVAYASPAGGESLWDLLFNKCHREYDDGDLDAVRFAVEVTDKTLAKKFPELASRLLY